MWRVCVRIAVDVSKWSFKPLLLLFGHYTSHVPKLVMQIQMHYNLKPTHTRIYLAVIWAHAQYYRPFLIGVRAVLSRCNNMFTLIQITHLGHFLWTSFMIDWLVKYFVRAQETIIHSPWVVWLCFPTETRTLNTRRYWLAWRGTGRLKQLPWIHLNILQTAHGLVVG